MSEMLFFWLLAGLITACSLVVVSAKNPITAAAFLVIDLFLLAAVYASQGADFVAAIQVIVYTGAVVVLFLFVIMILNLDADSLQVPNRSKFEKGILGVLLAGFAFVAYKFFESSSSDSFASYQMEDNTKAVAWELFRNYLWPFELVSILILLAIVGSIMIARKRNQSES